MIDHNNNEAIVHNIEEPLLCRTSHLGFIKISGDDALSFLQGQFSNDVNQVTESKTQMNSYNSPKGRMYASFRLCKIADAYFMILPKEIIETVSKRLRMFIMRSKVTLENVSDSWSSFGLVGKNLEKIISSLPQALDGVIENNGVHIMRLPGNIDRFLCVGPINQVQTLQEILAEQLPQADYVHWLRLDIHAGLANIYSKTQEAFVPQMVNFQLVNGVSFTKGCYPGQEVVARMHYLGKLKKRMYRISIAKMEPTESGANIYESGMDNPQSVGQIVDAQLNERGGMDALAVLQIASAENHTLHLGSVDGPIISIEPLPYSFSAE